MGHGAGANLARLDLLLEVLHRDVLPEVAVHIHHDGVDAFHGIKDGAKEIVVGDLRGVLLALQSQPLSHKTIAEGYPVHIGVGHMVCIEVARGTAELGSNGQRLQEVQLLLKTIGKYLYLLTQAGGRCRLAMRLCQHRDVFPLLGIGLQLGNKLFQQGIIDLCQRFLHGERHGRIVDVLRRQSEMDELLVGHPFGFFVELFFQEILYGLDVVIGDSLKLLHAAGIVLRELLPDETDVKRFFRKKQSHECREVLTLHTHPITDESIL